MKVEALRPTAPHHPLAPRAQALRRRLEGPRPSKVPSFLMEDKCNDLCLVFFSSSKVRCETTGFEMRVGSGRKEALGAELEGRRTEVLEEDPSLAFTYCCSPC